MPSTYMVSAQTLTTLRDRVEQFLADTTNLKFVTGVFALMRTDVPPPAGTKYARVWFVKGHTLSGLDSATVTTFPPSIDWLLELGAAGHALFSRALALSEDVDFDTTATPNLLRAPAAPGEEV